MKKTTYYSMTFFSFFIKIFIHYFDSYLPYLEDAESIGIGLDLCNPWESG